MNHCGLQLGGSAEEGICKAKGKTKKGGTKPEVASQGSTAVSKEKVEGKGTSSDGAKEGSGNAEAATMNANVKKLEEEVVTPGTGEAASPGAMMTEVKSFLKALSISNGRASIRACQVRKLSEARDGPVLLYAGALLEDGNGKGVRAGDPDSGAVGEWHSGAEEGPHHRVCPFKGKGTDHHPDLQDGRGRTLAGLESAGVRGSLCSARQAAYPSCFRKWRRKASTEPRSGSSWSVA